MINATGRRSQVVVLCAVSLFGEYGKGCEEGSIDVKQIRTLRKERP